MGSSRHLQLPGGMVHAVPQFVHLASRARNSGGVCNILLAGLQHGDIIESGTEQGLPAPALLLANVLSEALGSLTRLLMLLAQLLTLMSTTRK